MFNAFNHPNFRAADTNVSFNNIAGDENLGKPLNPAFGVLEWRGARDSVWIEAQLLMDDL